MLGRIIGKWLSTLIPTNKPKRLLLSCKIKKTSHPPLNFNINSVKQVQFQKHLGVYLDGKSDLCEQLQNMFKKVNKTISLLGKLKKHTESSVSSNLLIAYKATSRLRRHFIWPTFNNSFQERLESIQYNAALAITDAIRIVQEKLYEELGFESLQQRQRYRKLCLFFKINLPSTSLN